MLGEGLVTQGFALSCHVVFLTHLEQVPNVVQVSEPDNLLGVVVVTLILDPGVGIQELEDQGQVILVDEVDHYGSINLLLKVMSKLTE